MRDSDRGGKSGNGSDNVAPQMLNGRYQLISQVGGGGMAQVYKARDTVLGRTVAVKILREQYASDSQFVARFRREAQAAANLAHPNIVNVYDVGQDGNLHYIVMEFISGDNLKAFIKRYAPLPTDRAVSIAMQMLSGLEYAHRSGLIHRDVKPQNVVITSDGVAKLTDFGIAKSVSDLGLTEAGTALGTAHYFSPEQARGERVLPQSDIYAVGVTVYEMLTGQLPFESDNVMGLAYKHISEAPRPLRHLNPAVPPRLEAIVLKALSKETADRFGSAAEMERALRAVLAGGQQPTVEVPVAQAHVSQAGGRQAPRTGTPRTGPLRPGDTQGVYPMAAGGVTAGGAGVATRRMTNPMSAPTSVAVHPPQVRPTSGGCSTVAITLFLLGLLVVVLAGAVWAARELPEILRDPVVPSPTPTPVIPTSTPTSTPIPPSPTPSETPTMTPTMTPTPISVPVPDLVGLKLADAEALATQNGFTVVVLERIDSAQWPEGVVAQQDPAANTILKQTSQVGVRVSNGPPPFKLPNLTNTDPEQARATLEQAGLTVRLAYEGHDTIPKGVVVRTDPQADSNVRAGETITLVISRGVLVKVPDLRGVENQEVAQDILEAAGLILGVVTEVDDPTGAVPPGAVLNQDPPASTDVEKDSPVNIQVRRRE